MVSHFGARRRIHLETSGTPKIRKNIKHVIQGPFQLEYYQ